MPDVLLMARPTAGDDGFEARWLQVGSVFADKPFENPEENKRFQVLVVDQHTPVTDALLDQLPNVRFVCSSTTGHTHFKFDQESRKITLVTLKGEVRFLSEVRSVAEFTFLSLLRLARPNDRAGVTLNRKIMGVIGYGRIGKHVVEIASGFKMFPTYYDVGCTERKLEQIFERADVISIHLSENKTTKKLISRDLIERMKPTAFLINTARPSVLDEQALYDSLIEKRIAGAALDVVGKRPPNLPNLYVTPHIAGNTLEDRIKTDEFIVRKLKRLINAH